VILWRVSNHRTLDGRGGLSVPGRWHTRGQHILYCAPNPATALLEVLVHLNIDLEDVPIHFRYLEIEAPDETSTETVDVKALAQDWQLSPDISRQVGDEWLGSGRTTLLRVPSVIVPATWNLLLNPRHPESAQIRIVRTHSHPIDLRLLR